MSEDRTIELVIRVLTVGGQHVDHRYSMPSDDKEAEETINGLANMMLRAITPKTSAIVWFDSPLILYNPDNIIGIRTDILGLEKDKHIFGTRLKKKLGLNL